MSHSLSFSRHFVRLVMPLLAALAIVSCSTKRNIVAGDANTVTPSRDINNSPSISPEALANPVDALIAEAHSWKGTPYLWGGNDRDGVDCSGFVTQVYIRALGIKLPRTSATQSEYCSSLKREHLQPGDLVFFSTDSSRKGIVTHVGMYIGEGNMIHSSSSRGVIVSSLDNTYYKRTFHSAGRVDRLHQLIANAPKLPSTSVNPKPVANPVSDTTVEKKPKAIKEKKAKEKQKKEKKEKKEKKVKQPAASEKAKPVAKPVARQSAATPATAEDAREMFLKSLNETSSDSLFTTPSRR